ncbi:MAG: N-methylhydantoinase A [Gammaproteobacteria bacterium]|jgi:N-methylhydantoinase A
MVESTSGTVVLGIDVGGTFTDVLAFDPHNGAIVAAYKVPSTASNPAEGAITGVDRYLQHGGATVRAVFHGTTVGTNILIEKKGGPTALLTTDGFRDVLVLRRQARPRLYDLSPRVSPPLVERRWRLEVNERLNHDGSVALALQAAEIDRMVAMLHDEKLASVAISLLHAYANDAHERALGDAIKAAHPRLFVTLSSEVCREFREYERTSTVVVNAYIGRAVARYIEALERELRARGIAQLAIVKSNGGLTSASNAARYPAQLIESGPAAGIIAAAALGKEEGFADLIAFDMGGTTAKVGVVRGGQPRLSNEFEADRFVDGVDRGGYPIKSPVVDVIEIGAGGGSIARVDAAGVIKVGPHSAGAEPGPACYGRGGQQATVTDAHVCLGHISAQGFGSEDLQIDAAAAHEVVRRHIAAPLGWSVPRAAWGILTLATANMAEVVRLATLRRGLDPREFALVAFGGAGPLHAAEIAREVGVREVIIPPYPGLFSAIGTLLGDVRHDLVQTYLRLSADLDSATLNKAYNELMARAEILVAAEDADLKGWRYERSADLRFEGQLFELSLPLEDGPQANGAMLERAFRKAYRSNYGYDLHDHAVEVVNLRLVARAPVWRGGWPSTGSPAPSSATTPARRLTHTRDGSQREVEVLTRTALLAGQALDGPAIIEDFGSTIRVLDGQSVTVRASGVLVIRDHESSKDSA